MNILYHLTILPPQRPECEALSQEIRALQNRFGGELVYLNPNQHAPLYIPRLLFGFHKLEHLWATEAALDLHHLYNPDPFPFWVLRWLKRPVVYSISSGLGDRRPNVNFFNALAAVAVYDERGLNKLKQWGVTNCVLVKPGIDTSRFTCTPIPLQSEIKLVVGSAPWTRGQFKTKGIDALLQAAQRLPRLRLIFLWRGLLADAMLRRVRQMKLASQVTVLDRQVNVNAVLAEAHASITLATDPAIIKSYPHSLLDSLAAGKPVIVSQSIPMADYVKQTGCGVIAARVTADDVLAAVAALTQNYAALQKSAQAAGPRDFGLAALLNSMRQVYEYALSKTPG
jgi:glycosyltransferase involved in cell wall biosynthesis